MKLKTTVNLEQMNKLTNEEQEILKRLRQDYEEDQKSNKGRESHISNPDKFNFPIGMDDEGNLFPVNEQDEKSK